MSEAEQSGVHLVPVDSEHAALHQVLGGVSADTVARVVLTASGGPFRSWPSSRIDTATVADALDHPTWKMGTKITIDSATMMNKGLEIIEAHHLFALPEDRIDVVVHPESLVHCIVELIDGTMIAQMAPNDMRLPILYALSWPDRLAAPIPALDFVGASKLTFEAPNDEKFPALNLARSALHDGGEMTAVLNAANEVAVAAFLDGRCSLPAITATVEETLNRWAARNRPLTQIEQALAADREARAIARQTLGKYLPIEIGSE
jgi:1-deoxy-D-xylulose-5-phosphate reductoisomerase